MAGDDMAAQFVAKAQGALEVELRALAPMIARGLGEGFAGHVDREPVAPLVHDGQAHSRAGDRRTEVDRVEVVAGADNEA